MKLIDLFSGAGGLSCGLSLVGFEPVYACEKEPAYAETYKRNHPKTLLSQEDIQRVEIASVMADLGIREGELDLIAGGPPCQGFSINAPIRILEDERNHLFKEYMRFVEAFRPKAVLLENVAGIVSLGKGTVVKSIYQDLESMGYVVDHKILFAAHYGIPQARHRTFFVGIHKGLGKFSFPKPTHDAEAKANFTGAKELCLNVLPLFSKMLKQHVTVREALSDLPLQVAANEGEQLAYQSLPTCEYQVYLRKDNREELVYNHQSGRLSEINRKRLNHIPQGGSWRDIPFELLPAGMKRAKRSDHTKRYGRLHPDGLCSTILTKCDPHWGSFFHPTEQRVLSVREAARMQSFPDSFHFQGSLTSQYEQVGNAVPPLLATAIGEQIAEAIKSSSRKIKKHG